MVYINIQIITVGVSKLYSFGKDIMLIVPRNVITLDFGSGFGIWERDGKCTKVVLVAHLV